MSPRPLTASADERERQWRLLAEVDSALRNHISDSREERTRVDEQIAFLRADQRETRAEVHELRTEVRDLRGDVRAMGLRSAAGAGGVAALLPLAMSAGDTVWPLLKAFGRAVGAMLGWW